MQSQILKATLKFYLFYQAILLISNLFLILSHILGISGSATRPRSGNLSVISQLLCKLSYSTISKYVLFKVETYKLPVVNYRHNLLRPHSKTQMEELCVCIAHAWSQRRISKSRPIDYKSIALPLSYAGMNAGRRILTFAK